jgi:hypothetical protein
LVKIERSIEQFLDRLVDANSQTLIKTYETRVQTLEEQKVQLREKIAQCGKPLQDFDTTFRTALQFLANPTNLWLSDRIEDKRATLKLTFSDPVVYDRNHGFRTALTSSAFKLLSHIDKEEMEMVPQGRDRTTDTAIFSEPDYRFKRLQTGSYSPPQTGISVSRTAQAASDRFTLFQSKFSIWFPIGTQARTQRCSST